MPGYKSLVVVLSICFVILTLPIVASAQQSTPIDLKQLPVTTPLGGGTPYYSLPSDVTLCGMNFPLNNQDVYERLDMEFTIVVYGQSQVFLWMKRAGKYFPWIERRLAEEGLPDDIKYLAVAESDLRPHVFSPAQALGAWQFIATTGRRFGLKRDKNFDERLSFEESTEAAIKYLKKLYAEFGDWLLVMAAYNCGEGCVRREIQEQGLKNYFYMDLPQETERYVYRIAAIKVVLSDPARYGFVMPEKEKYKPVVADTIPVNLPAEVHFTQVAQAVGTTYKTLRELNPEIKGRYLPRGAYEISVPYGMGAKAAAYLNQLAATLKKSATPAETKSSAPSGKYHVVKAGDTLTNIAKRNGVSIDQIQKLNNLKGSNIQIGQKLKLTP